MKKIILFMMILGMNYSGFGQDYERINPGFGQKESYNLIGFLNGKYYIYTDNKLMFIADSNLQNYELVNKFDLPKFSSNFQSELQICYNSIYARDDYYMYKSEDFGKTFKKIFKHNIDILNGICTLNDTVYYCTNQSIYKIINDTCQLVFDFKTSKYKDSLAFVTNMVTDNNSLYLFGDYGVFKSTNSGINWNFILRYDYIDYVSAIKYAIIGDTLVLYAASSIYNSVNGGKTWRKSSNNLYTNIVGLKSGIFTLKDGNLYRINLVNDSLEYYSTIDTDYKYVWYTKLNNRLLAICSNYDNNDDVWYLSDESCKLWKKITPIFNSKIQAFNISEKNIFVRNESLYRYSNNNGDSWKSLNIKFKYDSYPSFFLKNQNLFVSGYKTGLFSTQDFGTNWKRINSIPCYKSNYLYIDKTDTCFVNSGFYLSNKDTVMEINFDNTSNIQKINDKIVIIGMYNLIVQNNDKSFKKYYFSEGVRSSFIDYNIIYFGMKGKLIFTNNLGSNWDTIKLPKPYDTLLVKNIFKRNNDLYVSVDSTILLSSDNGLKFQEINYNLKNSTFQFIEELDGNIFCLNKNYGIFSLDKNNKKWVDCNGGLNINKIYKLINYDGFLYALSDYEVYRSTNYGNSWIGIGAQSLNDSLININITNNVLVVGTQINGMFQFTSINSFNRYNLNYLSSRIYDMYYSDSLAIIADEENGCFFSRDNMSTWDKIKFPNNLKSSGKIISNGKLFIFDYGSKYFSTLDFKSWKIDSIKANNILSFDNENYIFISDNSFYFTNDNLKSTKKVSNLPYISYSFIINNKLFLMTRDSGLISFNKTGMYLGRQNSLKFLNGLNITKHFNNENYLFFVLNNNLFRTNISILDVNDYEKNNVSSHISPNPAIDYIVVNNVISSEARNPEIEIYNIFGILQELPRPSGTPSKEGETRIDVSNLPAGVYFVKIGDRFEKFIKI
jgi:photosystem II stability/assembly factor-like uncharacterized protein